MTLYPQSEDGQTSWVFHGPHGHLLHLRAVVVGGRGSDGLVVVEVF